MSLQSRLRAALKEQGLSARAASLKAGSNPRLVGDILDGHSRSPRSDTIEKLAKALNLSPAWLMGGGGPEAETAGGPYLVRVPILGVVEAGAFREIDPIDDTDESERATLPVVQTGHQAERLFALGVRGPSINKYSKEGDWLICAHAWDVLPQGANPDHFLDGKYVAVERIKPDNTREVTVKRYVAKPGHAAELWPDSDHPAHQKPITYDNDHGAEVRIFGVVRYKIEAAP